MLGMGVLVLGVGVGVGAGFGQVYLVTFGLGVLCG